MLTGEQRYRQVIVKDRIEGNRNIRLFWKGRSTYCRRPASGNISAARSNGPTMPAGAMPNLSGN